MNKKFLEMVLVGIFLVGFVAIMILLPFGSTQEMTIGVQYPYINDFRWGIVVGMLVGAFFVNLGWLTVCVGRSGWRLKHE